jgi:hypothetical protein
LTEEVAQKRIGALNAVRVSRALTDGEYEVCSLSFRQRELRARHRFIEKNVSLSVLSLHLTEPPKPVNPS